MTRNSVLLSAAALGSLLAAGPLAASQAAAQGAPQSLNLVRVDVVHLADGYRASKINGSTVYNSDNERIGMIDDLIVSRDDHVWYAILSVGGYLGIGSHLVAIPYQALQIRDDNKFVLPQASKDDLTSLPEFKYQRG
jgi:hypothetical protein